MTIATAILLAAVFTRPMERVVTMDPIMAQSAYDYRASRLVYESVLSIDYAARPYRVAPGACELPEVSADGMVYRFRLRDGELTSEDAVREIERLRNPTNAAPGGFMLRKVVSVTALGEREFEICLSERQHVFPWMLTYVGIAKRDGSGTGAYELVSWRKNHEMVFRRRGERGARSEERGGFDEIRYLVIDDMSTQWLMFLKGEIDMLGEISRDNWDSIISADGRLAPKLEAEGVRLCETSTLDSMYIGVNMSDPVLGKNRKLRQALNAAFDFEAWRKFYNGRIEMSDGPIPHGVDGRLETPFKYASDLSLAKRLMAEAGYADGIDPATGRRLVLHLAIGRANQDSREAGELLAAFYERVGVRLELSFMTWDAFCKALNERRCQLYRIGWVGDYPDAENFLQLFHSRNVSPGPNHSNYENPEFDREYDAAMATSDVAERNAHWRRCQEIIREDCPWVFTHYPKSYSLVRRRVGNYLPGAFPYGNERYYKVAEP